MRPTHSISRILTRLAALAVGGACGGTVLAACGDSSSLQSPKSTFANPPAEQEPQLTGLCGRDLSGAVKAASDFDYLAFVRFAPDADFDAGVTDPDGGTTTYPCSITRTVRNGQGSACSGADDQAACRAELAKAPSGAEKLCLNPGPNPYTLATPFIAEIVATRGSEVFHFRPGDAALGAALAPITTAEEAAFLVPGPHQHGAEACTGQDACDQRLTYGMEAVARPEGGFAVTVDATQNSMCDDEAGHVRRVYAVGSDGSVSAGPLEVVTPAGDECAMCGRAFEGEARLASADAPAARLVRAAYYEAGSVLSFRRLARELRAHGAPRELVDAARSAARDEIRHARATDRLARALGARDVARPRSKALPVRSLFEVALENAAEGCVNEAFAAAIGLVQSRRAHEQAFREALSAIASDEVRHAELAWAVAGWAEAQLTEDERARVHAARTEALERLRASEGADGSDDAATQRILGLPSKAEAKAMAAAMAEAILDCAA